MICRKARRGIDLDTFAQIVEDMADGKCNSEMMLCFPALMLIKQFGGRNRNAKAVKELLSQRLDLWDEKRYSALLRNVTDVWNRGNGTNSGVRRNENDKDASLAKKYDAMTKDGRLRNAVRMVDQQSGGGGGGKLYRYNDKDSKSGEPVIDVLRSKFPETVVPEEEDFDPSTSGPPEDTPPIYLKRHQASGKEAQQRNWYGRCGWPDGSILDNELRRSFKTPEGGARPYRNDPCERVAALHNVPGT